MEERKNKAWKKKRNKVLCLCMNSAVAHVLRSLTQCKTSSTCKYLEFASSWIKGFLLPSPYMGRMQVTWQVTASVKSLAVMYTHHTRFTKGLMQLSQNLTTSSLMTNSTFEWANRSRRLLTRRLVEDSELVFPSPLSYLSGSTTFLLASRLDY